MSAASIASPAGGSLASQLDTWRLRVEQQLDRWLPAATAVPERLHAAQRYSVLAPGKRIRPALVYATAQTLALPLDAVDAAACAVELIHCYSLIHDDLPAMDDDDLRRGLPTCHKAFDEATAILAGDALLTHAFEILADEATHPDAAVRVALVSKLAKAAGVAGMVGGQMLDIEAETANAAELAHIGLIQSLKT
ncbi:MAG TPA: polyprenyl synthetase family protein, partial [Steroidobacteraceae bacterium]